MEGFEKLGDFYLGRAYDLAAGRVTDELVLYDSSDLVTHAVCVGMTGSGKTGLCVGLLEEAAIDGIPSLVIDPKGDLPNLLLTFPDLEPASFRPWINEQDAAAQGLTPDEFARDQARLWEEGLAQWGQSGERIGRLREAAEFTVYTPGSTAGMPLSILASFAAPAAVVRDDEDLLSDRVLTTATSLLSLLGIDADPLQSREHILVSTILGQAWRAGQDLDLPSLIVQIQNPPVTRVGVMELESFYPKDERFGLAVRLNNLLAAPGFQTWMEGEPLDVGRLLFTAEGRPRVSILSIAHLDESQRMFFVSLLLNEVLGWVRSQPGTASVRALVYMDEIFGFFPPVAEPPSKRPLLSLLKQARAHGVGVVLATQNPVDLDYKGLGNTGTWFIGRLQTERDKARVLEGLEGVAAGPGGSVLDRAAMERTLSGLGQRVFLLYNVHEEGPQIFQTRWTLSYLRGPMTREHIKLLMDPRKAESAASSAAAQPAAATLAPTSATLASAAEISSTTAGPLVSTERPMSAEVSSPAGVPPLVAPDVPQHFIPARGSGPAGGSIVYRPGLLGAATLHYLDAKRDIDTQSSLVCLVPAGSDVAPVDWETAALVELVTEDLDPTPAAEAVFATLPAAFAAAKSYTAWRREFAGWVYRTQALQLWHSPTLKLTSKPGESEREFQARLQLAAREERDAWKQTLREKYEPKAAALEERIRRAEQAVDREKEQAAGQSVQTAISFGTTLLGAFLGRKKVSTATLGRATTAARGVGRSLDQAGDVGRARETVETLRAKRAELEAEFEDELSAAETRFDPAAEVLQVVAVRPRKSDITVGMLTLAWEPYWQMADGNLQRAWQ